MHASLILMLAAAAPPLVTPTVAAAAIVAFLLNATQLLDAAKGLWGAILPTKYQWIPGVVITSAAGIEQALTNGVTTWTQLVVPFLFAAGAFVPGARTAAHAATENVALSLANHSELSPDAQKQAQRSVASAQRGVAFAARLVGMALTVALAILLTGCSGPLPPVKTIGTDVGSVAVLAAQYETDGALWLSRISDAEAVLFTLAPDPAAKAELDALLADGRSALATAGEATAGVQDLTQGQLDAAYEKFRGVVAEITADAVKLGLFKGAASSRVAGAPPTTVPAPLAVSRFGGNS